MTVKFWAKSRMNASLISSWSFDSKNSWKSEHSEIIWYRLHSGVLKNMWKSSCLGLHLFILEKVRHLQLPLVHYSSQSQSRFFFPHRGCLHSSVGTFFFLWCNHLFLIQKALSFLSNLILVVKSIVIVELSAKKEQFVHKSLSWFRTGHRRLFPM